MALDSQPVTAGSTTNFPTAPELAAQLDATGAGRLLQWLEARALFLTATAAVIVLSFAGIPSHLAQDGWLALVAGRIIATHGIPHHDYLTVMAHGVRWIDQQWLAQLTMYGLEAAGGLALLTVVYVLLTGAAFALAVATARSLGGHDRHVTLMLPLGAFFYLATAVSIRTQGFAYPLFVATLWLLASEVRRPTERRVYLVFPLLVLWANLHGSVTLGVGIAVIYGVTLLAGGVQSLGWRGLANRRGLAFVVGAPLTLFVTPYGLGIIHYYRDTLLNPEFGKLITEWQPVTAYTEMAVPLLLLILATVWMLGRSGRRTPAFDQLVLAMLALGGIFAVRNVTWFGLGVMILLPATITQLRSKERVAKRNRRVNLTLAAGSVALVMLGAVGTFARPTHWFVSTYPTRAVSVVAKVVTQRPHTKIWADVRFADWLVWNDPALAGHIAYDTSFENLTSSQLASLTTLTQAEVHGKPNTVGPYALLMLDPGNKSVNQVLLARHGVKVLLRSKRVIIASQPVS